MCWTAPPSPFSSRRARSRRSASTTASRERWVIRKLDSVTKEPLAGVEFELTYAEGGYVDDANGHLSSKGLYTTDSNGEIRISGVTGTIVVKETKTIDGYTIDPATRLRP